MNDQPTEPTVEAEQKPPENEAPPMVDEYGFSPTRMVRAKWSRNHGKLYIFRVWRNVDKPELEQERELKGPEYETALVEFAESKLLDQLCQRVQGTWIEPIAFGGPNGGFIMLCEVHFVGVKAFYREIDGKKVAEYEPPTTEEVLRQVKVRAKHLKTVLDEKAADRTEAELREMIEANAAEVGIVLPGQGDAGNIVSIELENMAAEGVPITGETLRGGANER